MPSPPLLSALLSVKVTPQPLWEQQGSRPSRSDASQLLLSHFWGKGRAALLASLPAPATPEAVAVPRRLQVVPFLVLAVGVDNMFVLAHALQRQVMCYASARASAPGNMTVLMHTL